MADLFKRVGEAGAVSGVVISIDSPGGTTTGAEELYRGIRQLADKKPLVAFVDGTAASGGYITAIAADHIVARETSLVGSIGVLFQYPDVSKLLDTVGVKVEEIKSAPLKAEPSPLPSDEPGSARRLAGGRRATPTTGSSVSSPSAASSTRRNSAPFQPDGSSTVGRACPCGSSTSSAASATPSLGSSASGAFGAIFPCAIGSRATRAASTCGRRAAVSADLLGFGEVAVRLRQGGAAAQLATLDGLLALWQPTLEK